jgi:hypothetical protein
MSKRCYGSEGDEEMAERVDYEWDITMEELD